jgi:putative transposase
VSDDTTTRLEAVQVDESKLKAHVDEVVRTSVEETLNALLDAEADRICGAQRYERSPERVDRRAGHYERQLETKAGDVTLKVPRSQRAAGAAWGKPRWKKPWARCIWRG